AILIFSNPIGAALFLFLFIERDHPRPKAEPDQLVTAANSQDGHSGRSNEIRKVRKDSRMIVIEIAQRTAEDDGVGLKVCRGFRYRADVDNLSLRLFNQTGDVGDDVLQRECGNLSLLL